MADLRKLEFRLHDVSFGIWQDDASDPTLKSEIFDGLIRFLRRSGWHIGRDEEVHNRHRCLSPYHRALCKGPLLGAMSISGRAVELRLWSTDWPSTNNNGHRYCFDVLSRMPFLTRMRVRLVARQVQDWLAHHAKVTVSCGQGWAKRTTPRERIASEYAASWHSDRLLGRPVWRDPHNARSIDGLILEQDSRVWFADDRGRLRRGQAFYGLNNMWFVVAGGELKTLACHELYAEQPAELRRRRNDRRRRVALERLLGVAIAGMDFRRAEQLRTILFGTQPVYRIWSEKNDAFYGVNYSGYASDRIRAGCYTFDEARAEVQRVPHHLVAIAPNGDRLSASALEVAHA